MVNNLKANKMTAAKTLSMTPAAVRSRARRAAATTAFVVEKAPTKAVVKSTEGKAAPKARALPTASPIKVTAAQKRSIGQMCAAIASGFLPVASYVMAHVEAKTNPLLWVLVAAALMFSAPTLVDWAKKWCGSTYKAVGFTVLLEGVMVFSSTAWLSYTGLAILVAINATNAWGLAARKEQKLTEVM
jgi:hypothetical protein